VGLTDRCGGTKKVVAGGSGPRARAPAWGSDCQSEAGLELKGFADAVTQLWTEVVREGSGSILVEIRWVDGDGQAMWRLGWSSTWQQHDRHWELGKEARCKGGSSADRRMTVIARWPCTQQR
jgi:hypothetical protein